MAQQYGYTGYYKPPKQPTSSIAQAAAGKKITATDPFGLLTDTTDSARVARTNATPHVPASTVIPASAAAPASGIPFHETPQIQGPSTAPTPSAAYDIHTDPALQEVDALTGKNDAEAQAAALQQKQAQLLQFGDAELARKLLGDNTIADAAGANPNSTLNQLQGQRDRHVHDLTEQLNQANLLYGGYRVTQEDQAAKDFQNALAEAASGVNSNIGQIDANLGQALGQNQAQRIQALLAAYANHKTDPGAGAAGTTSDTPPPDPGPEGDPYGGAGTGLSELDPRAALALAAATRRAVRV